MVEAAWESPDPLPRRTGTPGGLFSGAPGPSSFSGDVNARPERDHFQDVSRLGGRNARITHSKWVRRRHPQRFDGDGVKPSRYEFRIRGRLGERLLSSFEGFDAEVQPVETILSGSIEDQAALHGVLEHIESLGLELVEVRQVDERRESVARDTRR